MARVTYVKKAQKPTSCEKCGTKITPGMPYKWCAPRAHRAARGRKRVRCESCPSWRPSETTSSQHLGTIYGAQEAFQDFLSSWDREDAEALRSALTECSESLQEAVDSYTESADNIESGFGHETSMSEELREKATEVESWKDEIASAADDIEDFDEEAARTEAESRVKGEYEGVTGEDRPSEEDIEAEIEEAVNADREAWAEEQAGKCDIVDNCPI